MNRQIKKILIANRGEIAVRIINACRVMGITPVGVYSDIDKNAMHIRLVDESYHIGAPPALESYLKGDVLIDVAQKSGCDAIHPGYGFLAEKASFALKCREAGIIFIGPSPESIQLLGSKTASRKTMSKAGVPIVPGVDDADMTDEDIKNAANKIGFPILIKAAAGGGGKGMRVVNNAEEFDNALSAARREALAAFNDDTVFIEKFLVKPRHIEFQIFGDHHGNRVHLFERECSIQRRHQKIIEETPSPALTDDLRKRMGETAVKVAEASDYYNAGTVEFLLDETGHYYFLEVNTRIQVEHPITEECLGIDLVKEQISVAMGNPLSFTQDDISQKGHSIECRLYAEDPASGFLPSAGIVSCANLPLMPGVRIDTGVESGDEVSVYYDPIIAKLVATGSNRAEAIDRVIAALKQTAVLGISNNREFMIDVLNHDEFRKANLHIEFLKQHFPVWQPKELSDEELAEFFAAVMSITTTTKSSATTNEVGVPEPWDILGNWRIAEGNS